MSDPLFHFRDVGFAYHLEPVLQHIDWECRAGERWAVLGGNGSGKTTLARLLCDDIRPQRGELHAPAPEIIAHISFDLQRQMMERDRRFDDSELREDVFDVGTTVRHAVLRGRAARPDFEQLCQRLRIAHILDRGIRYISTGESRKTLIAGALQGRPQLLILDNPLEGLDREAQAEMKALLAELIASPLTLILLVKDAGDIPAGIDRVLVLENGEARVQATRQLQEAATTPTPALQLPDYSSASWAAEPWPAGSPLFCLRHVAVNFRGTRVLTDINWTFAGGQHACLRGPNGAGKSTLLALLCGDNDKAYGQDVTLFGRKRGSGESVWDIKKRFGIVSTALQLAGLRRVRVAELVAGGFFDSLGLYDDLGDGQRRHAERWLQALELWPLRRTRFEELSFGQQRLALLARAMVKSPLILILDEPCIGLDAVHRRQILEVVDRIARQGHTHILYVSHSAGEVPACINQYVELVPHGEEGYTAVVSPDHPHPGPLPPAGEGGAVNRGPAVS